MDKTLLSKNNSIILELYEYGIKRKKEIGENNVFDFSIGNPNIPCPKLVNDKLIELINNTDPVLLHGYTNSSGMLTTRKAIADYLNRTYSTNEDENFIYLTTGAAAGLSITFNALLNKNDEAILFAPYFPEYKIYIEKAGGIVKAIMCDENTFLPDLSLLEKSINNKTKIVVINSPNNPTGVIYKAEIIKQISAILEKKQKEYQHEIYLLSDEPYRELIYNGEKYPFITNFYDNSIITYSFSKSLSLPGERIGYILVSSKCKTKEKVFDSIKIAGRSLGFVCASSLFQFLIPYCLGITSSLNLYKENRDLLYSALKSLGYDVVYPDGAFYLFVKALEEDAVKFSFVARKYELLLVPSDTFGIKGYVRISYCVSKNTIRNSISAFKKLKEYYQGRF